MKGLSNLAMWDIEGVSGSITHGYMQRMGLSSWWCNFFFSFQKIVINHDTQATITAMHTRTAHIHTHLRREPSSGARGCRGREHCWWPTPKYIGPSISRRAYWHVHSFFTRKFQDLIGIQTVRAKGQHQTNKSTFRTCRQHHSWILLHAGSC